MPRRSPWFSLAVVGVVADLLWRVEVEHHGWAGLTWTGYFHLAVPAGVVMFLAWVAWWVDAPSRTRRIGIVAALALYALAAVPATTQRQSRAEQVGEAELDGAAFGCGEH